MVLRGMLLVAVTALGWIAPPAAAQSTNHWRFFTRADGLAETACTSITPGANGNLLVRHSTSNAVSVFDGYGFTLLPGPAGAPGRIYESQSGQLWTVSPGGLLEYRQSEWQLLPVAQIAVHYRAQRTNEITLLPVRHGRVLVLLPEVLLSVAAEHPEEVRTQTLLQASDISIGTFTRMVPATGGALWLAGTAGYAKSRHPVRVLSPSDSWDVATDPPPELSDAVPTETDPLIPAHGDIADRLILPGGIQWMASANGLARFAPPIWQADPHLQIKKSPRSVLSANDRALLEGLAEPGPWGALFKARNGDLWLGGDTRIVQVRGEDVKVFSSTNQIGPEQVSALAESPDGRMVCATPTKVWEFDGRDWVPLRSGFAGINDLHYARDGTLWVASDDGLHRQVRSAWVSNGTADGLPSERVTSVQEDETGSIVANTAKGFCRFNQNADLDPPRTVIHAKPEARIREGATLQVAFTGRDRWNVTTPGRLLFSYKLDEREWSPFQEDTEIILADLPVGRHLFLVRAMDRNANIDRQPARLEFTVMLPWYREVRLVIILTIAFAVACFFAALAFNRHRQLQHSYTEVERQVAERTRELERAQRDLLHSQKMNALGTLAAGIAHDFNNILSIIKGSAQIIEDNPGNEEKIRTRVDRIKTVVQQGAGIVEAMLGFSRQTPEQTAPCDLNAVITDTLRLLGDRFLRGTEVKFDRGEGLPTISVARDFVQQVLLNFILNAAEAMERGKTVRPQITLRTRLAKELPTGLILAPAPAESFLLISVTDTGEGISPENLPRIFEPFFTTKALSSQRGTGLGLSMVYELARKLEAGLAVVSQPGKGSTFTLVLPLRET